MAEINDKSRRTYKKSTQIKFKTSMIRSNLCDYSDAYIVVSGTIKITGSEHDDEGVIFKKCAPFTERISNINNYYSNR